MDIEMLIAERAYALWEAEGFPDGRDQEFWFIAESQLREQGVLGVAEAEEQALVPPLAALPVH